MKKFLCSLFFVLFSLLNIKAQVDTSFWFVAPDISATMGDNPIDLHIQTYNQAATVLVRQPANMSGVNATLVIPANTTQVLNLTPSITAVESAPVNSVSTKGIYISSTSNISAYYSIGAATNKEMIGLKGTRAKGVDFYLPVPNSIPSPTSVADGGVGFDVVATASGTTVLLITPRAACIGRAKNVTFAVNLLQGQTFSVKDNYTVNPSELAGSIISADKPIAVTVSGVVRSGTTTCNSYFADQITTSDNIGKDYVILRGQTSTTDIEYILSTVNATSLQITTGPSTVNTLINFGETYSVNVNAPISYIKSDKPIYVLHVSGYGCKMSGAQVPPAFCAGSYTNNFTRLSSDSLSLNLYTRTGFQNSFTLTSNGNNVPVPGASFSVVPGSGGALVAAKLTYSISDIPVGSHNVLRNSQDLFGLGVLNGGNTGGSSYAYGTDFGTSTFAYANIPPTATICSNTTFTLNGLVGGGPITGFWSFNGFGTLSGPNNQLTNNVYTPNPIDTNIKPVKIVLTTTGICPNRTDTLKLTVKQAPIVNAGTDLVTCSNNPTVQLNGNVLGPTNQGVWNVVAPGNGTFSPDVFTMSPQYFASNSDTTLNLLKMVLTSTNNAGCLPEQDTVYVYMNHAPTVKASPVNPIVKCSNNPNIFLTGVIGGTVTSTGQWTTTGTGFFNPNNLIVNTNYVPSNADLAAGTVTLKLTSTNNQQCKSVSDSVVVQFSDPPTVNVGVDLNSCKNNPVFTLSATIGGTVTNTGIWYGGAGTFSNSNTDLNPTYTASPFEVNAGFVVLSFSTTGNGICNGVSDQVRVDFQDKPVANFSVNTVCFNKPSVFTDITFNTEPLAIINYWKWDLDAGVTSNSVDPVYTYTAPGTYTVKLVTANSYGCKDSITKSVTVNALPAANFSVSRVCNGSAQEIFFTDMASIQPPATIPQGGYYWDFGGFGFSYAKDTSVIFPSQGIYNITHQVTSSDGCSSSLSQSVNITPKPMAKFLFINNSVPTVETNIAFIDSSRSAVSWNWDFGNGLFSTLQNPSTVYTANADYTVSLTITDQFGCPSTYTAIVRVNNIVAEITQLIPNIVSPNNDGKNDFWRLDFIQVFYPQADIEIYNRWGERIFKSIGYSNAWDGSYKGDPLPVGAYFYTIKLNDNKDNNVYKGTITLLK